MCCPVYIIYDTSEKLNPWTSLGQLLVSPSCALFPLSIRHCFCISFIELQNTFLSCLLHLPNAVDCWAYCKILLNREEKQVVAKAQLPQPCPITSMGLLQALSSWALRTESSLLFWGTSCTSRHLPAQLCLKRIYVTCSIKNYQTQ